jgi:hypothetical protein
MRWLAPVFQLWERVKGGSAGVESGDEWMNDG